jgi:RNA polymerase sigma factor (sigma-70 family)
MEESLDSWFRREILVHEAALVRFIRRTWRCDPAEVHDLRQETYTRVLEAARAARPTSVRPFLFATAKHLMTDRIRRQRVIAIDTVGDLDVLNDSVDELSPERRTAARLELRVLARAFDTLPDKCRETVWLRRVEHLSRKKVADRLGITEKTVDGHLTKGLRRLANVMFGHELTESEEDSKLKSLNGHTHGQQRTD